MQIKNLRTSATSEHEEQTALMDLVSLHCQKWPELKLLHAIPNGGWRHPATAKMLKREGVKPGVPDLELPIARGGFHGLHIEMKVGKNKPTKEQKAWMRALSSEGRKCVVCYSAEAAWEEIAKYINL